MLAYKNNSIALITFTLFYSVPANAEIASGARGEIAGGYESLSLGNGLNSGSGFRYGFEAGYDRALSKDMALGFDAGVAGGTAKSNQNISLAIPSAGPALTPFPTPFPGPTTTINIRTSQGRELYAGGRLTASLSSKFNIFAKAGYTNLRLKSTTTAFGAGAGPVAPGPSLSLSATVSENLDGVRLGVGGQFTLTKSLFLGTEYSYSNYEADVSRNQLLASLGFRF